MAELSSSAANVVILVAQDPPNYKVYKLVVDENELAALKACHGKFSGQEGLDEKLRSDFSW